MKHKGFAHIGIIILVIVVGLFFASSLYYTRYNTKEQLNRLLGKDNRLVTEENKENRYAEPTRPKNVPAIYKNDEWLLYPQTYGYGDIFRNAVRYKDYLIYIKQPEQGEDYVVALNVTDKDSQEIQLTTDRVLSESPLKYTDMGGNEIIVSYEDRPNAIPLYSIQILDNLLLIKYADYAAPSRLILIDLDNLAEYAGPSAILDGPNYPDIKKMGNLLVYSTSFGDGCGSRSTWQRLDSETFELYGNKIEFSNYKTVHIMSDEEVENIIYTKVAQVVEGFAGCPGVKLLSIHSSDLLDEDKMLVSLENLPDEIHYFVTENKTIYLVGEKSLFKYDLYSTNVEKVGDFEFNVREFYNAAFLEEGGICFGNRVLVDHTTAKTISEYSEKCLPDMNEINVKKESIPDGFEKLDLPEWFELR